uniref:Pentacotripeptide-repeat region of PRORP domain-containing protein n=1 Tax=Fagus sylvatica TaxID=28930 RepID=A0A2N9FS87_FAGSY
MTFVVQKCAKNLHNLVGPSISCALILDFSQSCSRAFSSCLSSPLESSHVIRSGYTHHEQQFEDSEGLSGLDILIARVPIGVSDNEVLQSLLHDQACNSIQLSSELVNKLLHKFKDDWKSALGAFRWAGSRSSYKHTPEAYDMLVDILGRMKQMDKMKALLEEMNQYHLVTLNTVAKVMRRFAGAGKWEDAVRTFDELGTFGLEKNTESMNLLLDTLCKENKVQQAREIFLELKSHISPDAYTFNIFIHGWCKNNFGKVYELLDEMQAQGCPPNVVTFTTILCSMAKSEEFEEAWHLVDRMKLAGCKPDTLFYNSLIYTLGRAGYVQEAVHIFEVEMPRTGANPNTSTYNSVIGIFCHHGQEQVALNVLNDMEESGPL